MSGHNDDVPVLSDVVECGNESIIQSSRLGREVLRELEALQQSASMDALGDFDYEDPLADDDDQPGDDDDDVLAGFGNDAPVEAEDDELELLIDDVVDRHITELRKDIRRLLERAKHIR